MTSLLLSAFIYLISAAIAVPLSKRLGLGSVLGYLIAGILIGPVFGLVGQETESIQHVAEFGVVLMLFLVGLELEPHKLWQLRYKLLGLGGLQVILTIAAITGIALLVGQPWTVGVAAGCVLAMSSTAIVLQTLGEKNLLNSQGGQACFSVLLFQDIAVIPMLALLPLLALPELSHQVDEVAHHSDSINLLAGMPGYQKAGITFGVIALIGLSPALGTFLAGVVLANSEYRHELESNIEPFKGLLLGLFFITVGAGIDMDYLYVKLWSILGLTLAVIVAKGAILWLLGLMFRLKRLHRSLFALALAQAGEFGFVLLTLVESNGVMPSAIAKKLLLVVALSMLFTPLLFIVYDKLIVPRAYQSAGPEQADDHIEQKHPVIIAGHGRFGRVVNAMLTACGYKTTVIDHNAATVAGYKRFGVETYFGDAARQEMLLTAGLAEAKLLVVAIDNPEQALQIVEFAHKINPSMKIVARSYDSQHTYELVHAGANEIVRENFDSAVRCGKRALECLGMPKPKAEEVGNLYFHRNRHGMAVAARAYDPSIGIFENKALIDIARVEIAETERLIRQLLHDQSIAWPQDAAETTTEHGDMNMSEPVQGG